VKGSRERETDARGEGKNQGGKAHGAREKGEGNDVG
jgi:hypothetical protein